MREIERIGSKKTKVNTILVEFGKEREEGKLLLISKPKQCG